MVKPIIIKCQSLQNKYAGYVEQSTLIHCLWKEEVNQHLWKAILQHITKQYTTKQYPLTQ